MRRSRGKARWRSDAHNERSAGFAAFLIVERRQMQLGQPFPQHSTMNEQRQRNRHPDRGYRHTIAPIGEFVVPVAHRLLKMNQWWVQRSTTPLVALITR